MKMQRNLLAVVIFMMAGLIYSNAIAMESWIKKYGDGGRLNSQQAYKTSSGETIITGSAIRGANRGGFVIKLNTDDTVQWKQKYGNWSLSINSAAEATDGDYLLVGSQGSNGLIVKVSSLDGSVLWAKEYKEASSSRLYSIKATSGNKFVVIGSHSSSIHGTGYVVMKLDSAFEIEWRTSFTNCYFSGGSSIDTAHEVTANDNSGNDFICIIPAKDAIARINGDDGEVEWVKKYTENDSSAKVVAISPTADGKFVALAKTYDRSRGHGMTVFMIKEDGELSSSSKIKVEEDNELPSSNGIKIDGNDSELPHSITAIDNGFLLSGSWASNRVAPYRKIMLFKLNLQFEIEWQKQILNNDYWAEPKGYIREYNGEIYFTGQYRIDYSNMPIIFAKLNLNGETGENCRSLNSFNYSPEPTTLTMVDQKHNHCLVDFWYIFQDSR